MSIFASPRFLRNVLFADAAVSLVTGVLQLALKDALAGLLRLPAPLLTGSGLFMLVYASAIAFAATREPISRPVVWVVVAGNLGWALACIALLASGLLAPTGLGTAWVLMQAAVVAVLAELQWTGLRRAPVVGWV